MHCHLTTHSKILISTTDSNNVSHLTWDELTDLITTNKTCKSTYLHTLCMAVRSDDLHLYIVCGQSFAFILKVYFKSAEKGCSSIVVYQARLSSLLVLYV